jgi:hypothetical protein
MLLSTACSSLWLSDTVSNCHPFIFIFNLGNKAKSQGTKSSWVGRIGKNNHVIVSHKLCGFQGCVGGRVVVMKELVVVSPKFRSFSLHIFSQASQNITVKVRVDHSVRRNKFTVNNHLYIEKKQLACALLNSRPATSYFLLVIVGSSTALIIDYCFASGS